MNTTTFTKLNDACEFIFDSIPGDIHCAAPLGLGKPNQLLNLIYQKAKLNPKRKLKLSTALSLEVPHPKKEIERKFLASFASRHFGDNYPELQYVLDEKKNLIPKNIQVHEFYMQAAQNLHVESAQRNYTSLNYTHVAQNLLEDNLDVIVQLIAQKKVGDQFRYSLSCNPDLTLDVSDLFKANKKKLFVVGVVHPELPFIGGDAEVSANFFDAVVQSEEVKHQLFALPILPLETSDYMIGLHASQFLQDDGTIQIGIGSLSDAIVHAAILRQNENEIYQNAIRVISNPESLDNPFLHRNRFEKGLYGTSEMVTDAFMHLRKAGILKRQIFDLDEEKKCYLHGAFFLGSKSFYSWLRHLDGPDRSGFSMTRVSKVNDLYDANEFALRKQRQKACFFNTCMSVDLLGGAAADTLTNGQVVSGVGGQYNFVAMSHELPDSRSILMLRSTHQVKGKSVSSIDWTFGNITIPRHLRDIVVTEYGIAFLRGRTDEEVICRLIEISDSRFQSELISKAKSFKKIKSDYVLPEWSRRNTPQALDSKIRSFSKQIFPDFPFGSDFSKAEENLAVALSELKKASSSPMKLINLIQLGTKNKANMFKPELERMQLLQPKSIIDRIYKRLLVGSLSSLKLDQ